MPLDQAASLAWLVHFGGFVGIKYELNRSAKYTMRASTEGYTTRGPEGPRRSRQDRRVRGRLRELCEEVLASYRVAQGQDLVTPEERDTAQQMLRSLTPRVAR